MRATPDSTLANPERRIADLERQLAECRAERDEALARETATAEVLHVINSSPGEMENARLITETREALEQQTATAEVLGVINSSSGDLAPVFDAILEKAMRLCGAAFGILNTYERETFHHAATRGVPPAYDEWRRRTEMSGPGTGHARIVAGEDIVHSLDLMAERPYPFFSILPPKKGNRLHGRGIRAGGRVRRAVFDHGSPQKGQSQVDHSAGVNLASRRESGAFLRTARHRFSEERKRRREIRAPWSNRYPKGACAR